MGLSDPRRAGFFGGKGLRWCRRDPQFAGGLHGEDTPVNRVAAASGCSGEVKKRVCRRIQQRERTDSLELIASR